jgi:ribosomal protein L16 Arg81 hydroxylase
MRTDALRLFRLFDEGATIVYREVEDHMPALAALCRSAEAHFHTPFVANVYLAPAGGQCFPIHYDARDVFALQISGSKRWRLHRPQRELPLPHEHCYDGLPDEGFLEEIELRAGDMLYCPRGFPHIVSAGEEPSLHVSLSTAATTWADLFSQALTEFVARDPAFRAGLPPGFVTAPDEAMEETFALLARRFADHVRVQPSLDRLRRQFLASRSTGAEDARLQAQHAKGLCAESRIAPRKHVVWRVEQGPEAISLIGLGKEIRFDPSALEALDSALHGRARKVRDLAGALGCEAKLDLANTLVANGFVVVEA